MDITKIYGTMAFTDAVMSERLPRDVYESLKLTQRMGTELDSSIAGAVAAAMRDWAIENGATHYTHWFQPMNNVTAGKHEAFIMPDQNNNGNVINEFSGKVRNVLSFMPYAEIQFVSAVTGQRLPRLFEMIDMVLENQTLRVATGVLNEILTEAVALQQPPSDKGRRLKIYYMTEVAVKPPTFVIFVNDKKLMHFSYLRYLENRIREAFGFRGTALKFIVRERREKEQ